MPWFSTRLILTACLVMVLPVTSMAQVTGPALQPGVGAAPATAPTTTTGEAATAAQPQAPPTAAAALDADYVLGAGDTIEVALVGRSDFNGRARISSDGAVLLPYIGAIPASGRTAAQLSDDIRAALEKGGFFSKPVVRVDIVGVGSRLVTVLGAVTTPGLMALDRNYHLSQIVARAGGRAAAGADSVIVTHPDGTSKTYKLAELATGAGDKDPIVASGDKIYVPPAENQVFYVTGQVKSPGAYPVTEGMTVRIALARAGGLTDDGSEKKVSIKRKGVDMKGVKLDVTTLEPGDIINVGERLF
jgi:polysaccharide export outer membrane protein